MKNSAIYSKIALVNDISILRLSTTVSTALTTALLYCQKGVICNTFMGDKMCIIVDLK